MLQGARATGKEGVETGEYIPSLDSKKVSILLLCNTVFVLL